jgi:hypothetical protein
MIECGVCAEPVVGIGRIIKRVEVADAAGTAVPIYDLCKAVAKTGGKELAEDLFRTYQAMHHRDPGRIRLKAAKGYVFTVIADELPVRQPRTFEGTPAEAIAQGWEATDRGWICPVCGKGGDAHRPEQSEAGTGGLETFFEETKDL